MPGPLTGGGWFSHRCVFAGPSGAVSLNHFLASVRILCLSSGLRRATSSWIMSPHIGRWVQTIVSIGLIMVVAPPSTVEHVSASLIYL